MYTKGTQYAIPQDKLALLSKFMRETYYATIWGQYMLFDVLGRGVSRPGVTKKIHTALFAKRMIELDPDHANEFKDIIARLDGKQPANHALTSKHTHYFREIILSIYVPHTLSTFAWHLPALHVANMETEKT